MEGQDHETSLGECIGKCIGYCIVWTLRLSVFLAFFAGTLWVLQLFGVI